MISGQDTTTMEQVPTMFRAPTQFCPKTVQDNILDLQFGKVTVSTISFPLPFVREFLIWSPGSKLPAYFFLHMYAIYIVRSIVTCNVHCYDEFSHCTREQVYMYVMLVIKLSILITHDDVNLCMV